MKYLLKTVTSAMCVAVAAQFSAYAAGAKAGGYKGVEFADPFIMLDGDTYYAYGTMGNHGIEVYTSQDLVEWRHAGRALDSKDSYADRWFWAPEIYRVGDRYLMYYSADEHICVAEAESPLGPFVQREKAPMYTDEKAIDNSLFIDADGTPYLYFDRFNDGLNIWVAELDDDLMTIKPSTLRPCIKRSQDWEFEGVNEGSFVTRHGDTYYMTYSGNGYTCPEYGIGVATASSPYGPWTKSDANPIFQFPVTEKYGRLEGVGHSAMFRDKDGQLRIVFHAHNSPGTVHPREMYISTVSFTDDPAPRMVISQEDIIKAVAVE
ncbi:MAG: family 43 glycosylhydrolase [Bacteroidales bacterium]|nr:family 43 glycosylhydrolase [Bacteroidales bacterium]